MRRFEQDNAGRHHEEIISNPKPKLEHIPEVPLNIDISHNNYDAQIRKELAELRHQAQQQNTETFFQTGHGTHTSHVIRSPRVAGNALEPEQDRSPD